MEFPSLSLLFLFVPLLVVLVVVRLWRKPFLAHPLAFYLKTRLPKAGIHTLLPQILLCISIGSLLVACLQPVFPFRLQRITRGGLQILLALDISSSMNQSLGYEEDPRSLTLVGDSQIQRVSKLDAVKTAAGDFISRRPNDALGLAVFSINAYVVSPPTLDHDNLQNYLAMLDINTLIGEGLTSVGEGLYLAHYLLTRERNRSPGSRKGKVIILLTDADHNYGRNPLPVISVIGKGGIHLYVVGVGLSEKSIGAEIVQAVRRTGGEYFDASNEQELRQIYLTIETIEKSRFTVEHYVRNYPAFSPFALLAIAALVGYGILRAIPHWIELV